MLMRTDPFTDWLSLPRTPQPTVAALVGRVLGGGLELAAACHARIAQIFDQCGLGAGILIGMGQGHHLPPFFKALAAGCPARR